MSGRGRPPAARYVSVVEQQQCVLSAKLYGVVDQQMYIDGSITDADTNINNWPSFAPDDRRRLITSARPLGDGIALVLVARGRVASKVWVGAVCA